MPHALIKSGAALFALNQSDVPNSCAIAMVATGFDRRIGIETELWTWSFMPQRRLLSLEFSYRGNHTAAAEFK